MDLSRKIPAILIVEDENLVGWALGSALKKTGFDCIAVRSGEGALEVIKSVAIDLVITDLKLPQIDGFEVAAAAKARFPEIPVIMISAGEGDDLRVPIQNCNIDEFVEKPFDLNEMTGVVGTLLHRGSKSILRNS
jgi:DNA-binding response OmpR family regulator